MIKILFCFKKQRLLVFLSLVLLISSSLFISEVSEEPREPEQQKAGTGKTTEKPVNPDYDQWKSHHRFYRGRGRGGGGGEEGMRRVIPRWCRDNPKFKETAGPRVGIVSFPGSGNTWVRYLLQQMTGILTGSVYEDGDLQRNGFKGEYHRSGKVLVVKTHEWGPIVRSDIRSMTVVAGGWHDNDNDNDNDYDQLQT